MCDSLSQKYRVLFSKRKRKENRYLMSKRFFKINLLPKYRGQFEYLNASRTFSY